MNSVKLISITPDAEKTMGYCARVSNPANQDNPDVARLLTYCIKNKHWSVFEMANAVLEITTSRAIAQQILRHRSFSFQEFSQRYASPTDFVVYEARRQDTKNRQNSLDDLPDDDRIWFQEMQRRTWVDAMTVYQEAITRGIAKECARFLLPLNVQTRLYMNGTIRSWLTYLGLRCSNGTQKEHMDVANECREILIKELPAVAVAMEWKESL